MGVAPLTFMRFRGPLVNGAKVGGSRAANPRIAGDVGGLGERYLAQEILSSLLAFPYSSFRSVSFVDARRRTVASV
jgi:hypothetical protein